MTVDQRLRNALTPLVPVVVPNLYTGTEETFIVYRYSVYPEAHGDNVPHALRYLVSVHLYADHFIDTVSLRAQIRNALRTAGFTYPNEINAATDEGQHYVFECALRGGLTA